ncbi:ImmA/IrrE family metallo-endopeptidase [Paenibacillus taichungensis]|uniref:ImmA/IrrE family metallo-endopeptidase n=1 Tax=Paenibacillus taichungensis TaxID=484184 RepID=UPI002DB5A08B|nr:ImmA/IrrE family metallo-endopeptidase [Paenibacillus taichungensis]MEC0200066.1 ImmA/IrrE family metallo-endopeptidase [Paenibacillus taichungensis]
MNNQELEALRNVSARCVARELAEIAFETYHGSKHPSFPVDIFAVLKHFNIMYKFLPLDNSEGMYIPDKDGSVPVVGIHYHRPYERQRFTAAHELCHHLRDYNTAMASPVGSRHPIEVYANEFAAEFLMPTIYFLEEVDKIVNPSGFVDPEKAISLARVFGVSFESAIRNLHHHGKINFEPTPSFFKSFGVLKKAKDLGIEDLDSTYLRNIIDSYSYIPQADTSPLWQRMKKTLIYHDNKLEGVDMEIEAVAEICNDMRLKLHSSEYYQQYKNNIKTIIILLKL